MKAIELSGFLDNEGVLKLEKPLNIKNQKVKIIVLIPEEEEITDTEWIKANANNPAFDFFKEDEEIYSLTDWGTSRR